MKHLLQRSISIFRENGALDLLRAVKRFIVYGSLQNEILNHIPATKRVLICYIQFGRLLYPSRFSDADPFKIVWIDPSMIKLDLSNEQIPMRFGRVYPGDWDQTNSAFSDRTVFTSIKSHFCEGTLWEETKYYQRMRTRLASGRSTRGCTSVDDLPDYFGRFDELYNSLKTDGYKTQSELMCSSPNETSKLNLDAPIPQLNEIGVCIGRDGEIYYGYRGQHRLAIAKVANVDAVAVQILVRHRKWQKLRDRLRNNPSSEKICMDHPDLADLTVDN